MNMQKQKVIKEFQGEYRWLSNFWPVPIQYGNNVYQSVEHAYMSAKSDDPIWKELCSSNIGPGRIKKLSKYIVLVPNWDNIKLIVMEECCTKKFTQEPFRSKLLATGNAHIQEGNSWGDTFWGVNLRTGKGKNNLGKIIMDIRKKLKGA